MAVVAFAPGFPDFGNVLPIGTRVPMQERYRRISNEEGIVDTNALLNVLIGAVAGTTATRTRSRVSHNSSAAKDNGGKMAIETVNTINRASTAGDVTALKALFTGQRKQPNPYVRDLSGNGGPAFTPG